MEGSSCSSESDARACSSFGQRFARIREALAPIAELVLLPKILSERAAGPEGIGENVFPLSLHHAPTPSLQTIADALMLARAQPNPILITGSLHFAGEVLAHLHGEPAAFEECAQ